MGSSGKGRGFGFSRLGPWPSAGSPSEGGALTVEPGSGSSPPFRPQEPSDVTIAARRTAATSLVDSGGVTSRLQEGACQDEHSNGFEVDRIGRGPSTCILLHFRDLDGGEREKLLGDGASDYFNATGSSEHCCDPCIDASIFGAGAGRRRPAPLRRCRTGKVDPFCFAAER